MLKKIILQCLFEFYRLFLSPALHLISGPTSGCRFNPTCSQYAKQVFENRSIFIALYLVTKRLLQCHPFGPVQARD